MIVIKKPDSIPDVILSGIENVKAMGGKDSCIALHDHDGIEEASSWYTSHPSAYDDLLSQSMTPSGNFSGMSMLLSTYGSIENVQRRANVVIDSEDDANDPSGGSSKENSHRLHRQYCDRSIIKDIF